MFLTRAHLVGRRLTMRPTDRLPKACKKYDLSIDARTRLTDCRGWETSRDSGGSGGPRWPVETGDLFLPSNGLSHDKEEARSWILSHRT